MIQELPIGVRFSMLHRAFKRKMDEMLSEKDLTGVQFGVLAGLMRLERQGREEISQRDLEQSSRIGHATMTDILRQSSRDRRFKCISSTEKALGLEGEAARVEHETFEWLTHGLSEEQTAALLAITDVMLHNAWADCRKGREESHD